MRIEIQINDIILIGILNDSLTAKRIAAALPFEGHVNVWGEEIYFEVPVQVNLEADALEEVAVGTMAYWPTGSAFCVFFGRTPASTSDLPRAYSSVNVFGNIEGDATPLKQVVHGTKIRVVKSVKQD